MAETDYDGTASWDTPKVAEVGDGTGSFWDNSFKKVVNRTKYLKDTIGAASIAAYAGTIWTISAGTLETFLHALADKAAKLDANAPFTGNVSAGGTLTVTGAASLSSTLNVSGATTVTSLKVQTFEEREPGTITNSGTTATIDASKPLWICDNWSNGAAGIAVTISDYGGTGSPEIEIVFVPASPSKTITVKRADTTSILVATGACSARFRWYTSKWRCMGGGSSLTDNTNFNPSFV